MKSKKTKRIVMIIMITITIIAGFLIAFKKKNNEIRNDEIPDNYIAVFHGGSGEVTYSTYIYKIDNGHANYGFEYINTTNTTVSWGSSKIKTKITDRGKFDWTDGAFTVAKKNGAYEYVMLPNSNKRYTIDEFMPMFLMN